MLLNKKNVIIKILFSLIIVTIITAVGRDGNQEAGPSGSQSPEYVSAVQSPEYYTAAESSERRGSYDSYSSEYAPSQYSGEISSKESTNDYEGVTSCWYYMKYYCEKRNPTAIDFAKMAVAKCSTGYFEPKRYMTEYYNNFSRYLNAENILPPDQYCRQFVPEPIKPLRLVEIEDEDDTSGLPIVKRGKYEASENTDDKRSECQRALRRFGTTSDEALKYGFYKTKIEEIDRSRIDSQVMFNIAVLLDQQQDFKGNYLRYMIENLKLHDIAGGIESPLEFCKKYDENEMTARRFGH